MINRNWKLTYAAHFGCQQRHIKYWYQLSAEQQEVARAKYAPGQYFFDWNKYVYRVTVAGLIVDRQLVARDDHNGLLPAA